MSKNDTPDKALVERLRAREAAANWYGCAVSELRELSTNKDETIAKLDREWLAATIFNNAGNRFMRASECYPIADAIIALTSTEKEG